MTEDDDSFITLILIFFWQVIKYGFPFKIRPWRTGQWGRGGGRNAFQTGEHWWSFKKFKKVFNTSLISINSITNPYNVLYRNKKKKKGVEGDKSQFDDDKISESEEVMKMAEMELPVVEGAGAGTDQSNLIYMEVSYFCLNIKNLN
jgi:hypothetical protein